MKRILVFLIVLSVVACAAAAEPAAAPVTNLTFATLAKTLVRMPPDLKEKETQQVIQARKFDKELQAFLASLRAKARIETIFKDLQFPEKTP